MNWNPGSTVYILFGVFLRNGVVNDTMDFLSSFQLSYPGTLCLAHVGSAVNLSAEHYEQPTRSKKGKNRGKSSTPIFPYHPPLEYDDMS